MKNSYSVRRPQLGRLLLWVVDQFVPVDAALASLAPVGSLALRPLAPDPVTGAPGFEGPGPKFNDLAPGYYAVHRLPTVDSTSFQ